ncbi:uncharacterized protein LOC131249862 [Magnolia sinica]|uniref:uncharacterized protein LOC131249862 n=1 Tax=Magnolia sinica TaxID=86752 RepID=UPI00265A8EB6|nr:uncharacterized protein LOC131249862 [Magnolia sinica]
MARPWTPERDPTPEDERCLFVTFSRGYPLTRGEIIDFFTQNWGDCVENVYVETSMAQEGPLYGRVIFNTRSMISLVLNGLEKVKFSVNGKPLWARMYRPRRVHS